MPEIVITEFMDEEIVRDMLTGRSYVYDATLVDNPALLKKRLADARAIVVRNRTRVGPETLKDAPKLQVVGRLGVGLDNIDLEACKARGIAVFPASGANDLAVAEYVIAAIFALVRGAFDARADMIAGKWPRTALIGGEVSGRVLGLVGFGAIARQTARLARALGMRVVAIDPYLEEQSALWEGVQRLEFRSLLEQSDVVSLHTPLTPQTRRLIDAGALSYFKEGALLINAARGGIVDEAALAAALRSGKLRGAALDVFEVEPLSAADASRFDGIGNLILTPHIAGVTVESNKRVSRVTLAAVLGELETRG